METFREVLQLSPCGTSNASQNGAEHAFSRDRTMPMPDAMYLGAEACPLNNQSHKL
jgi:hypothetical protein